MNVNEQLWNQPAYTGFHCTWLWKNQALMLCLLTHIKLKVFPDAKQTNPAQSGLLICCRGGQIKPSYVPDKRLRELRELTRLRVKYVQNRTAFKNRCQKVLNRVNIRLRSKLKDVFGKAGMEILNGLMAGKIG